MAVQIQTSVAVETLRSSNLQTPIPTSPRSFLEQTVEIELDGYNEILPEANNASVSCAVVTLQFSELRLAGFFQIMSKLLLLNTQ